jgi:hypothetical protein
MRWLAFVLVFPLSLCASFVQAQTSEAEPSDAPPSDAPSAHQGESGDDHWRHKVAAGFTPLNFAKYEGSHEGFDEAIDEFGVGAIGVTVSYSFAPWKYFEIRSQLEYMKPFVGREALDKGLHEFRGVLGVDGVLPLGCDYMQLTFGVDGGWVGWRLTELEQDRADFSASNALGWTLSWKAGFRGWITDHTGFWGESSFGAADASSVGDRGNGLSERWPLRVTLGWADRW